MIQRVQSIWLILAGATIMSLLFIPMVSTTVGSAEYKAMASGIFETTNGVEKKLEAFMPLMISTILVGLLCFGNVLNYKNRSLQKRGIVVTIVLLFGLSFWCSRYAQKIPGGLESATYGVGVFLPMVAILFCALAVRGINKDEKLIRSADRLR